MGYARYTATRPGGENIEAGHGIEIVCETSECPSEVDGGLCESKKKENRP